MKGRLKIVDLDFILFGGSAGGGFRRELLIVTLQTLPLPIPELRGSYSQHIMGLKQDWASLEYFIT